MNKPLLFMIMLLSFQLVDAYELADNLKLHGFLTQNAIHTSANNMYGNSEHSVSTDYTEAGVNVFYSPWEKFSFSLQGLYRNAGKVDVDTVDIDYAFIDFKLNEYDQGRNGIRLGRIKNPLGLFNETRDVAFTTPSIILPQSIYYDRSRSLLLSSDGGQFYWEHFNDNSDLTLKLLVGKARNDNDELLNAIIPYPTAFIPLAPEGELEPSSSDLSFLGQIVYERNAGEYVLAFSYADVSLDYDPKRGELFTAGTTDFDLYILSAQYNGEKLSLTGEYLYQKNNFRNFGPLYPDVEPTSESWYLQGGYRVKPNWQVYVRYDESYLNKDDRAGKSNDLIGVPRHIGFSRDIMAGLRWDISPSIMLRAEYHNINGTAWLTSADNPDRTETERYWDLFALQLSLRF